MLTTPSCDPLTARGLRQGHAAALAALAQREYDAWYPTDFDEYAGGGICHRIADRFVEYFDAEGVQAEAVSCCHEQHVYTVAVLTDGVYRVDVPYSCYERGSGYSWTKLPDVRLEADDVVVDRLHADPSRYADYVDG